MFKAEIWLVKLRVLANEWKNLVLSSPSCSHLNLAFCLYLISSWAAISMNSSLIRLLSFLTRSERSSSASFESISWIFRKRSSLICDMLPEVDLFHSLRRSFRHLSFWWRRIPGHLPWGVWSQADFTTVLNNLSLIHMFPNLKGASPSFVLSVSKRSGQDWRLV